MLKIFDPPRRVFDMLCPYEKKIAEVQGGGDFE